MKIRSDSVSNSISSSFVFSTRLNPVALSDHINEVLKRNGKIRLDDHFHNEMIIRYCCSFYQLLFLGWISFPTKVEDETINMLHGEYIGNFNFDNILMKDWYQPRSWEEQKKHIESSLQDIINYNNCLIFSGRSPEIGKITKDTLKLTKKFQEIYGNIHLDQSKIDLIEDSINCGDNVYFATFRDDSEGRDSTSIFIPESANIRIERIDSKKFEDIFDLPVLIDLENDYKE